MGSRAQLCLTDCPLTNTINTDTTQKAQVYLHHKMGYRVPVEIYASPIKDKNGEIIGVVELFYDATEYKIMNERLKQLEQLALVDELTKLFNRRYVNLIVKNKIAEVKRFNRLFGFFMFDIDDFKHINDNFGHKVGDLVLQMVASTLKSNFRADDVAGRLGGDEFIVIVGVKTPKDILEIAKKINMLINNSFLTIENQILTVTISIGATYIKKEDNLSSLLERADKLMYESKKRGKNTISSDISAE